MTSPLEVNAEALMVSLPEAATTVLIPVSVEAYPPKEMEELPLSWRTSKEDDLENAVSPMVVALEICRVSVPLPPAMVLVARADA